MPGIQLEEVSRQFGPVTAVDRVSLVIRQGEFVTLLGPSGCGKTTTLRMVAGLEQNDGGRISIGDRVVSDTAAKLFVPPDKRRIGMVFQSYAIWPHMTVFENVAYPLRIRRRPKAEVTEKVTSALKLVEMESFADRPAPHLSGGQQQRVAIARALVFQPEVLLLDEPLSNLDAKLRAQTGDEFRALQKRLGITTLYVTHDQEEAMALSDRVVVMQAGFILQAGTPEEIYRHPRSRAVAGFFGSPNFLQATVLGCERATGERYRVTVDGTDWKGACPAGEQFSAGEKALIMLRPENVTLAATAGALRDGEVEWSGKVRDTVFRGARRSIFAEASGRHFTVEAPSEQAFEPGQPVTIRVNLNQSWALRP